MALRKKKVSESPPPPPPPPPTPPLISFFGTCASFEAGGGPKKKQYVVPPLSQIPGSAPGLFYNFLVLFSVSIFACAILFYCIFIISFFHLNISMCFVPRAARYSEGSLFRTHKFRTYPEVR